MKSIEWLGNSLKILDQSKLPVETVYRNALSYKDVAEAIEHMEVRGAPAIGAAAAYGFVLGALEYSGNREGLTSFMDMVQDRLAVTRPTAVNLFWALRRMEDRLRECWDVDDLDDVRQVLIEEAGRIAEDDRRMNRLIGEYGNEIVPEKANILTHCNAGSLATGGYGTALGVIRAAKEAGKKVHVFVDETRPVLQGSRLTAWELKEDNIPVTLITDNMAGYFMAKGIISLCLVGADRVAANGDVANKIGTYSVAILAKEHGIPFYVAAPTSTIDFSLSTGEKIPIEERPSTEVSCVVGKVNVAPPGISIANPAFDITPARYITGIITEKGIFTPKRLSLLNKKTLSRRNHGKI